MTIGWRTAISALTGIILATAAVPARAQSVDGANGGSRYQLEEVVVTAQKRTENVRDVPMALTVFSGDAMKEAGIYGLNDLARHIPNVSINESSSSLYVRGIGTAELNPIGEQAIAYILDGVYVPKFDYLNGGFLDLERMEVLKGPQGTLFGRNATAGVFNITNAKPSQEWTANVLLTGGERDIQEGEAALSGPITDHLAFRVAARKRTEDGSSKSIPSGEGLNEREQEIFRVSLRYDISDTADVSISYTEWDFFFGVFMGNEFHVYPDDLRGPINNLDPHLEAVLDRRTSLPKHDGNREFELRTEGKGKLIPLEINWEVWGHTLTSVTSYGRVESFRGGDVDWTAADLVGLLGDISDEQWSQEFRITSPPGRFEYVAGLYYFENETISLLQVPLYSDFATLAGAGILGTLDANALLDTGGDDPERLDNLVGDFELETISTGIYGQAKWNIDDHWSVIVGVRQSEDEKDAIISLTAEGPVPFWSQVSDAPFTVNEVVVDKDFSPKYSVTWEPIEELTVYATYAKGFRAGSYNAGATTTDNVSFRAERSRTIEAGVKTELLDGRVRWNVGLFQTDYNDYQLSAFTGLGYVTANAPEVQMRGSEMDVTALLLPGLILNAAVGYNDARFVDHVNGACTSESASEQTAAGHLGNPTTPRNDCDLSGKDLHRAPRWSVTFRLDYSVPLANLGVPWELFAGFDATYKDDEKFDSDLDPDDSEDDYWIYNAQLGLAAVDGTWRLAFHGKNLSDELRKIWSGDGLAQPGSHVAMTNDPRYFFASFSYRY